MRLTLRHTSYGLAFLFLLLIAFYLHRSFFEVLNSGMEVRIPYLGMPFQLFKFIFIIVNLIGILVCLFFIFKNHRKFNKVALRLALFDLFYSLISFLWVAIAYKITEKPQENLLKYIINTMLGKPQEGLNSWDEIGIMAPTHFIRYLYLMNFLNTLIMVVVALLLIFFRHKAEKKLNLKENQ
ncbi:hypothetical protein AMS62_20065 [Bacillus sp. FJAT-18019]|nr:hypothetical protein AMS62_20065 [Bacillus sp. FJAT-18019]